MSSADLSRSGVRARSRFRILALVAVTGIVLLCFLPGNLKMALHTRGRLHSAGHFVGFFGAGYVLNRTSRSTEIRLLLLLLTLLLGIGTEFGEHLAFGTNLEWEDVAVDALGSVVGTALARFSSRRRVGSFERA